MSHISSFSLLQRAFNMSLHNEFPPYTSLPIFYLYFILFSFLHAVRPHFLLILLSSFLPTFLSCFLPTFLSYFLLPRSLFLSSSPIITSLLMFSFIPTLSLFLPFFLLCVLPAFPSSFIHSSIPPSASALILYSFLTLYIFFFLSLPTFLPFA